jgi:DNA-binding transcriptional MerR regulator
MGLSRSAVFHHSTIPSFQSSYLPKEARAMTEAAEELPLVESATQKKTYYSISEVCARTGLEPHVLRYWETEFPQLRPKKNRAGNRAYREKDIELVEYIKRLLYEEQYTIPGAKRKCAQVKDRDTAETPETSGDLGLLERKELIKLLREVVELLRGAPR